VAAADENAELRVVFAIPKKPSLRFRVRQVVYAFFHIQLSEAQPAVFVLNRAGVPRRLFDVPDPRQVQEKARLVAVDLETLGLSEFCGRYRVPHSFIDATEMPRHRLPQLHPLF